MNGWSAGEACLRFLLLVLGLVAMTSLRSVFQQMVARGANPLGAAMQPHRGLALALFVGQLVTSLGGFAGWAELAMLGLATCRASPWRWVPAPAGAPAGGMAGRSRIANRLRRPVREAWCSPSC